MLRIADSCLDPPISARPGCSSLGGLDISEGVFERGFPNGESRSNSVVLVPPDPPSATLFARRLGRLRTVSDVSRAKDGPSHDEDTIGAYRLQLVTPNSVTRRQGFVASGGGFVAGRGF